MRRIMTIAIGLILRRSLGMVVSRLGELLAEPAQGPKAVGRQVRTHGPELEAILAGPGIDLVRGARERLVEIAERRRRLERRRLPRTAFEPKHVLLDPRGRVLVRHRGPAHVS